MQKKLLVTLVAAVITGPLWACKMTPEGAERKFSEAIEAKAESDKPWPWCKVKSSSRAQADTWVVNMSGILCFDRIYTARIDPDCSVTVEAK